MFTCEDCGTQITGKKLLDYVVDQFAEHSADIWYEKSSAELLPPGTVCGKCGSAKLAKEKDILDVWFDSGSSHLAVLNDRWNLDWPADLYLEGGDQYRGWFHSSLLLGVGLKGGAPYRECSTNGWTLDEKGQAMSKSLGNVVEPEKVIKASGAEILRLWVGSIEYQEDVRLSDTILQRLVEAYRKMRNTFKYALGNLHDFNPETDAVPTAELEEFDQWILVRAEALTAKVRDFYRDFAFHRVYQAFYNFATTDLSSIYFDVLKDRLYTTTPKSQARRSAQTAMWRVTDALVRLMAPILTFTTEEVWTHLPKRQDAAESVHLTLFPEPADLTQGLTAAHRARLDNWERLIAVRETVNKSLETARREKLIGAPLEAKVHLKANSDLLPLLERYERYLPALFITSQVSLESHGEADVAIHIDKAAGVKCERCWKYTLDVGSDVKLPTVCAPCAAAVTEILGL